MKTSSAPGCQLAPALPCAAEVGGFRIRTHLIALVMAALVPIIIFSAVMVFMHLQQTRNAGRQLLQTMAEESSERVDHELRRTIGGLRALARSDALSDHDLPSFYALAGRLVKAQGWDHLALFGAGGEPLVDTRMPFGAVLPPLDSPQLPIESAMSRQPRVSDLVKGAVSDQPLTLICVPVVQGQTVKYVIAVGLTPAKLHKVIEDQIGRSRGMRVALLDRHSEVIANTYQGAPGLVSEAIRNVSWDRPAGERDSTSDQVATIGGQRAYVTSYESGFSGWKVVTFLPVQALDSMLYRTITIMAGGFLLLLFVGLSLALLLGRRTTNSLSQLVASVRAVAAGGEPLPIQGHVVEVTQASQAVNETAAQLAARRCELEAADHAKNAFLALLGHELRNPLAPIRNAVQLMKQAGCDGEVAQWSINVIDRQSAHLSRLVDDLLDVTRIDHGKIALRKQVLDVRQLLQSAVQDHRGVLEQAGVLLAMDVPSTPVLVDCDGVRLGQIIGNVLHNATKFTSRGGRIALRAALEGKLAVIEVSDSGSGILPENLERIFELFAQEQASGVGGNSGLGIGLALTRKLVELHGGKISAASAGPGQGSTFRIELPALTIGNVDEPIAGTTASAVDNAGARVLVVDDNKDSADSLREVLAMSGFVGTVAYSGQAALLAVERDLPDAVLLDIGLPDIDGYEVCRRLRRSRTAGQPVLIALTGWGQDKDRELATNAGFDAHLTKPAGPDQVIAALRESLARQRPAAPLAQRCGMSLTE